MNQCLDAIPERRPKSIELCNIILEWIFCRKTDLDSVSHEEFIDADEFIPQEISSEVTMHPEAVYISRHMSFTNLPEPTNSTRVQVENLEGTLNYFFLHYVSFYINLF